MSEFVSCVRHGRQAVLTGRHKIPHPLQLPHSMGCSLQTAEASVAYECVGSVSCGCPFVDDIDTGHELTLFVGGAR